MNTFEYLEQKRKKINKKNIIFIVSFSILAIPALVSLIYSYSLFIKNNLSFEMFFLITMLVISIFLILVVKVNVLLKRNSEAINDEYKKKVVMPFLNENFSNVIYKTRDEISHDLIKSFNVIDMGKKYLSNDYLRITYDDITFEMVDVNIIERDYDGIDYNLFKGQMYIFNYVTNFISDTYICSKNFLSYKKQGIFSNRMYKKTIFNDEFLDKKYFIYCEHQNSEISSGIISLIKKIDLAFNESVFLYFKDGKLFFNINDGKDFFELNINKKISEASIYESLTSNISEIKKVVALFKK